MKKKTKLEYAMEFLAFNVNTDITDFDEIYNSIEVITLAIATAREPSCDRSIRLQQTSISHGIIMMRKHMANSAAKR